MFSYEVKVRQVNAGKMKGVATLVVDNLIEVEGFKIYEGSKGLFVSLPSHKGKGKDEQGNEIEKYYDDVRAIGDSGEELINEIKEEMLKAFSNLSGQSAPVKAVQQRGTAASAVTASAKQTVTVKAQEPTSVPPKPKKPLW
jgi:DNA-binding cell septation regulator SpoVG